MTCAETQGLGNELWNLDLFTSLIALNSDPLENIVSCLLYPCNVPHKNDSPKIKFGNVELNRNAYLIANNLQVLSTDVLHFNKIFNKRTFLNYEPYTKLQLHLPFVGLVNVSPNLIIDKDYQIKWIIDYTTGNMQTLVIADKKTVVDVNCKIGMSINLSSTNMLSAVANGTNELAGGIMSVNPAQIVNGMSGLLGGAPTQQNGTPSSSTSVCGDLSTYWIVDRVSYTETELYNQTYGVPLMESHALIELKGYTLCANVKVSCDGTSEEKEEIKRLLESGVYIL